MFCGMAMSTVKPGQMDALVAAALDHANALESQPGCLGTYVLSERGGSTQVSISIFESEESFERAAQATLPVIAAHHLENLVEGSPSFRYFDVRGSPG
jgi:heme-degrading monooxygenase HmoA